MLSFAVDPAFSLVSGAICALANNVVPKNFYFGCQFPRKSATLTKFTDKIQDSSQSAE
jgi:hypothetical protein